jgi:hypothetical protein
MQLWYQYNNAVGKKEGSFLGLAKKLEVFGLSYRRGLYFAGFRVRARRLTKGGKGRKTFQEH